MSMALQQLAFPVWQTQQPVNLRQTHEGGYSAACTSCPASPAANQNQASPEGGSFSSSFVLS